MLRLLLGLAIVVFITAAAQTYTSGISLNSLTFFSSTGGNTSTLYIAVLAAMTFLGILSSGIFAELRSHDKSSRISDAILKAVSHKKLFIALLVSPIVFNSVYLVTGESASSLSDFLLSYQNGFFWEAILASTHSKIKDT